MKKSYKNIVNKLILVGILASSTTWVMESKEPEKGASVPMLQRTLVQRGKIQDLPVKGASRELIKLQGWIRIADAKDYVPEIRIYFNGMESFNNKEGFLSFPLEDEVSKIGVIFTKNIDYKHHKKNTLRELVIKKSENYCYFTLTQDEDGEWELTENKKRVNNFSVPQNAIVLMVNPECFKKFERSRIKLADNILSLPRIVLKGGKIRVGADKAVLKGCKTYREWIERQGKQSLLHSLGLTPYHEQVREEYKDMPEGRGMITLTQ